MTVAQVRFMRKAQQQLASLHEYFYAGFAPVTDGQLTHDERADKRRAPEDAAWQPVAIGAKWEGRDQYYWLRFPLTVPVLEDSAHYVLHMNLGRSGEGNNSGFEGLLFVDGMPRQAVDSNHQDAYFAAEESGRTYQLAIKLWTGLEGGGVPRVQHYTLKALCAGVIDATVVDCYDYLQNIVGVSNELPEDEPLRYAYVDLINQSFAQFKWAELDQAGVHRVCAAVLGQIHRFIQAHAGQKKAYQITAVGHTHIDVAWLWRLRHTREKVARSFSTVLELMKEYPDYQFFQSTPQDYAFLAEDYPELFAQIEQRVAEGRWEANGATWLEPDTNLTSGESLTRQFLYGGQYFKQHFNARQNVLWLPDVFGYSAATPQIMLGFGVTHFMTTKISWNDTDRQPHDTFFWQGIDGSKVLTHCITTTECVPDYGERTGWRYTYNGELVPSTVFGSYRVYADKAVNADLLLSYGYGDGGGGPSREQIKNRRILNELPGTPTVVPGRVDDYFDRLSQRVAASPTKPAVWQGELYLEYHRGTYTSQAQIKQDNRRAEFALRNLEWRYATAHLQLGVEYPTDQIRALWVILMRNQFHDILPGSAIHEVYEDAAAEFKQLFAGVRKLNHALDARVQTPAAGKAVVVNPLAWPREALVPIGKTLTKVAVPALASVTVDAAAPTASDALCSRVEGLQLTTPFYRLTIAQDGHLEDLYDLRLQRPLLTAAGGNVLSLYEDRPLDFDNWNIDKDYPTKRTDLVADSVQVVANTATHTDVVATYRFGRSTMTQRMRLYAASPRIDFLTDVDWHQRQELLRTAFNTPLHASQARFDIQYGNVERPTSDNTTWEQAKFETVGHKWADLSEPDYGLALLNDCKYGYRVKDSQLSLSLLKAGNDPDPKADEGRHTCTYSLWPHAGDFRQGRVEQAASELNQPLAVFEGAADDRLLPLFDSDQAALALDAVKMSEDGRYLVIRFHEYEGRHTQVTLTPNVTLHEVFRGELNETKRNDDSLLHDGQVQYTMAPYEIVTLLCC